MRRGRGFGAYEKGVLLGVGAALLAGCAPSAQGDADATEGRPALTIGRDNYPPFCYLDEGGEYTGIDVDILTGALDRIGYGADFLQIEWDRKDELLSNRTIDGIASCFSMNGREDLYRWAGPYMQLRQVVAVMPESDIRTLADLRDKVVAVQVTTKLEEIFLSGEDKRIPLLGKVFSLLGRRGQPGRYPTAEGDRCAQAHGRGHRGDRGCPADRAERAERLEGRGRARKAGRWQLCLRRDEQT